MACFHVNHVLDGMVIPEDTIGSLHLSGCAGNISTHSRDMRLAHSYLAHGNLTLVEEKAQTGQHREARLNLSEHPHESLLLNLEASNRFAELFPVHRVVVSRLIGASHSSYKNPGD